MADRAKKPQIDVIELSTQPVCNADEPEVRSGTDAESSQAGHSSKNTLVTYVYISLFAIIGCLIRIGMDHTVGSEIAKIENPGTIVFKSFFSNMLGSYLLGILHASSLIDHSSLFYVGLTAGMCGCITTFSKWNQQVSSLLAGAEDVDGQPQVVAFSALLVGILSFVSSYVFGRDTVNMLSQKKKPTEPSAGAITTNCHNHLTVLVFVVLLLSIGGLTALAVIYSNKDPFVLALAVSGLFAPFGASLRTVISQKIPHFQNKTCTVFNAIPTGTLLANITGSALIASTVVIESFVRMDCTSRAIVAGIQSGFLASLTTVSTLVGEIFTLRKNENYTSPVVSYLYACLTIVGCVLAGFLINIANQTVLRQAYMSDPSNLNVSFFHWKQSFQPDCGL